MQPSKSVTQTGQQSLPTFIVKISTSSSPRVRRMAPLCSVILRVAIYVRRSIETLFSSLIVTVVAPSLHTFPHLFENCLISCAFFQH